MGSQRRLPLPSSAGEIGGEHLGNALKARPAAPA